MLMRPQLWQNIRTESGITACEACHRLLYYASPVDVEGAMNV
jgi:predicted  nucleic acid-binding Zn-ribbon protein